MYENKAFIFLITILGAITLLSCTEHDTTQEEDFATLEDMYEDIQTLAYSRPCTDASEWRLTPIGAKPCGGPWRYLAYHSSIDTVPFLNMVEEYYQFNEKLNIKWGLGSDCMVVGAPSEIDCADSKPVFVYASP